MYRGRLIYTILVTLKFFSKLFARLLLLTNRNIISEKTAQNYAGLYTKAAALVKEYTTPPFNDPSLPTLYEYYTQAGITKGLEDLSDGFYLNGKEILIISGSVHYFRIHPKLWRDRLRKMRACGLNCIDT